MNLPNRLTLLRVVLVPAALVFALYPVGGETCARLLCAAIFGITAITDMLDGKIARRYNLITDFGKFLDPLADKFMVIGMLSAFCASDMYARFAPVLIWADCIVILRELTVTSLRLVVAASPQRVVVPANMLGKIKTVTQIVCILVLTLEPVLLPFDRIFLLSWLSVAAMTVMTVWSGVHYLRAYLPYIDTDK